MGNIENVEIISARPEDADFIAWIVAQGMHLNSVPTFLNKLGARDDTLYSWQNTRLLQCDGKLAGGLVSYDGSTHEERRRNTWVMPDGRLLSSGDVPETTAGETAESKPEETTKAVKESQAEETETKAESETTVTKTEPAVKPTTKTPKPVHSEPEDEKEPVPSEPKASYEE